MSEERPKAATDLSIRRADPADVAAIIDVCAAALGWLPEEPNETFFRWKHVDNSFGPSPIWLALEDDEIVGVRAFLRWRLAHPKHGAVEMVRAVDTAVLPRAQGRGIFSRLTSAGIAELAGEGVYGVFNTPNDKSRPGYLKLGWHELGRSPIQLRPTGVFVIPRIARSRVAAEKWGQATGVGHRPADILGDHGAVGRLLGSLPATAGWHTELSPDYLTWRYGLSDLHYRVEPIGDSTEKGLIVFRIRRRGAMSELDVCDALVPAGGERAARAAVRRLARTGNADVVITAPGRWSRRYVPAPFLGPILTWRALTDDAPPPLDQTALSLGTIELF